MQGALAPVRAQPPFQNFDVEALLTRHDPRQSPVAMNGYPPPMGAPASAWRATKTADGREYYFNAATNVTTWEKPDELKDEVEVGLVSWVNSLG